METPLILIIKLYFIGTFFNLFLPSSIGGDSIKGYFIYKNTNKKSSSLHAIFLDRLIGLYVLCFFSLIAIIYILFFSTIKIENGQNILLSVFLFLVLAIFLPFFGKTNLLKKISFLKKFDEFFSNIDEVLNKKKKMLIPVILTVIFQISVVSVSFIMSKAIGLDINFIYFLLIIPINTIITLIPITFSGVGLREFSFLYLFSLVGIIDGRLVLIPLLVFFVNVILGLIGGIIYINSDFSKRIIKLK